jgi:hypothetical protein
MADFFDRSAPFASLGGAPSTGAAATPSAQQEQAAPSQTPDPALTLWRDWSAAHQRVLVLTREWQRLETRVVRSAASTPQKNRGDAARELGLDVVDADLGAALAAEQRLAAVIAETDAASLPGVAAKLAMIILAGETRPYDDAPPWPELRSILTDLARLGAPDAVVFLT